MNNTQYLAFMRNELNRSKRWRKDKSSQYDEQWRRYVDLYSGKHYDAKSNVDQLTVNLIFSTINTMAPAVAINNPKFVVHARNEASSDGATTAEEVLNYMWRTHNYQREFRLAVLDWLLCGHGWLKVGFKATKEPESKKADIDPNDKDVAHGEGEDEGVDDREDVEGSVESEMNMAIDEDRPFVERISIFDVYVDPDARHPKEMRWIAQRVWRAVQDVHVDERYSATNRKRVSGSSYSRWDNADQDGRRSSDKPPGGAIKYAEIIEFYDIKRNKVSTFSCDSDDNDDSGFLIKPEPIPFAFGQPFVMLRNYEVPDHFYPLGDVCQIESLQLELNETRNQILNYRKRFRRAWLYARDLFDRDGVQALNSDEDNVMVPVMGDTNPSEAIAPVPAVITPSEFFDQSAMISNDIDRVSGVSDYQRGAQQAIRRTATEAAMIQDAANSRAQDRLAKVEGILAEVAERVVQVMQQFTTGEQVARIVTIPVQGWVTYDAKSLAGRFSYEVVGGSTEPQNETFRRQSAMQIVDMSVPFIQAGVVNMPNLYMKLLRDGFGIKETERFIQEPPPPEMPPEQMPPEQAPVEGAAPAPAPTAPGQPPLDPSMIDPEALLRQVDPSVAPGISPEEMAMMDPEQLLQMVDPSLAAGLSPEEIAMMDPEELLQIVDQGAMPMQP